MLCNHLSLVPEHFITPKGSPVPIKQSLPTTPPQPMQPPIYVQSVDLRTPGIFSEWHHAPCDLVPGFRLRCFPEGSWVSLPGSLEGHWKVGTACPKRSPRTADTGLSLIFMAAKDPAPVLLQSASLFVFHFCPAVF